MRELAERAIEVATGLGASYADARIIDLKKEIIQTKNEALAALDLISSQGIGIRVLYNGGWGFACTQDLSRDGIGQAAQKAAMVAKASATCVKPPFKLAGEPAHHGTWVSPHSIDPFTISVESKIAVLLECAKIMACVNGITLSRGEMTFAKEKKLFVSSEGSIIDQTFIRSSCGIEAHATRGDDRQRRSWPIHSVGSMKMPAGKL